MPSPAIAPSELRRRYRAVRAVTESLCAPLLTEDYFLVCMKDALDHPGVTLLREALQGDAWRQAMAALPGYTAHPQSGEILSLTRALPWWSYKAPKAKLTP